MLIKAYSSVGNGRKKHRDLRGIRFGKLLVISECKKRKNLKVYWNCVCDCGIRKPICGQSLFRGLSLSCGCLVVERNIQRTRHGLTNSPEHRAWRALKTRCTAKNNPAYPDYGARGITFSMAWHTFENFYFDMGPRPTSKHTLERKDTNGNYCRDNCIWATRQDQNKNTRRARRWSIDGQYFQSLTDAAIKLGVSSATICRWCRGYTVNGKKRPPKKACYSHLIYGDKNGK